jgi:hypothetical protein
MLLNVGSYTSVAFFQAVMLQQLRIKRSLLNQVRQCLCGSLSARNLLLLSFRR